MNEKLFKYLKNDPSKNHHILSTGIEEENQNEVNLSIDEVLNHFIKLIKIEFCDDDFLNAKNYKTSLKTDFTKFKKEHSYSEKKSEPNMRKLEKPDLVCG